MMNAVFYILFAIFAVVGFVELIRGLVFRFYKSKKDNCIMLISPHCRHSEDIEYTLRSCAAKVSWMGKSMPCRVICLDKGMDKATKQICDYICDEYEFMETMCIDEVVALLHNECNT